MPLICNPFLYFIADEIQILDKQKLAKLLEMAFDSGQNVGKNEAYEKYGLLSETLIKNQNVDESFRSLLDLNSLGGHSHREEVPISSSNRDQMETHGGFGHRGSYGSNPRIGNANDLLRDSYAGREQPLRDPYKNREHTLRDMTSDRGYTQRDSFGSRNLQRDSYQGDTHQNDFIGFSKTVNDSRDDIHDARRTMGNQNNGRSFNDGMFGRNSYDGGRANFNSYMDAMQSSRNVSSTFDRNSRIDNRSIEGLFQSSSILDRSRFANLVGYKKYRDQITKLLDF